MALRTRYVNTDSTAGGDGTTNGTAGATRAYESLAAAITAEVAAQADLSVDTLDILLTAGTTADTAAVDVNGFTNASSTNYVRIRANTGQEAVMPWSASIYRLTPANNVAPLLISVAYTRVERIQVALDTGASNLIAVQGADVTGIQVIGCLIRSTGAGAGANYGLFSSLTNSGNTFHARNCVVIGFPNATGIRSTNGGGCYIYNCTVSGASMGIDGSNQFRARNCITHSCSTDWNTTWHADSNYNASEDTTAPGANSRLSQTFTFVNAAGGDFHLDSADAGAKNFGEDLSGIGAAAFQFSEDFDNATRSGTWDIGADEITAGTAALTGTITASITEADIVTGGKTIILTLTGDTWIPA